MQCVIHSRLVGYLIHNVPYLIDRHKETDDKCGMEQVIHPFVIHGTLWPPTLIAILGIRIMWVWDENTSIMDEY
jgi:hypothetical protein